MINIIIAILLIGVLIVFHEFGHFIVAKANGVAVLEFAIGFGPHLIKIRKGDTDYCINLIPLGGYCMMLGMDDAETGNFKTSEDEDEEETPLEAHKRELEEKYGSGASFASKSVWTRIAIVLAGPIGNFLLAFILSVIVIGNVGVDTAVIDYVESDSVAEQAGIEAGDTIVKMNGSKVNFERDYSFYRYFHASNTLDLTLIKADGTEYTATITPEYQKKNAYKMGVTITSEREVSGVGMDSAAEKAGIKTGDVITAVDGVKMETNSQITNAVSQSEGKEIALTIQRDGETLEVKVIPAFQETIAYNTGLTLLGYREKVSPVKVLYYAGAETVYWMKAVGTSLANMFTGRVGVNDLSGPVGMVDSISNLVESSKPDGTYYVILNVLNYGIMLSANLGVMNLLPIPGLDGGRLIFLILEVIRRKPVKKEHEGAVTLVGMILILLLAGYVLFHDISKLF